MKKEYIMPLIYVHELKPASQLMYTSNLHNQDAQAPGLAKEGWVMWSDDEPEEVDY